MLNRNLYISIIVFIGSCVFTSCENNDLAKIKKVTSNEKFANVVMYDANISYTDSALKKVEISGPLINNYETVEAPYLEFPKGIVVHFYNAQGAVSSSITANYAIYTKVNELWEARGNVVGQSEKNDTILTEQLFWNQKDGKVYSNLYSKIISADGVFFGENGFDAEQDFSRWVLKGSKGSVNVKEEKNDSISKKQT